MTVFTKINEAEVQNTDGFSVSFSRTMLTYREGSHVLGIDVEHAFEPYRLVLYPSTMESWYPPFQDEPITNGKAVEILDRIKKALDFLDVPVELD